MEAMDWTQLECLARIPLKQQMVARCIITNPIPELNYKPNNKAIEFSILLVLF